MGAYAPVSELDEDALAELVEQVHRPVLAELARRGTPFVGLLYAGLMLTDAGPKVLEFNCRFGDPECQAIMPRLDGDLLALLQAAATGQGLPAALAWSPRASVCVVMTSAGYPGRYETGRPITGVAAAARLPGINVFQAGTAMAGDALVTAGGRVLGVQASGVDVGAAIRAEVEQASGR
jgi:phosphoribosylamine--glycine ligase